MRKLIALELSRMPMATYWRAALMTALVLLSLLYLFAYAPTMDPTDQDLELFKGYGNILPLFSAMTMTAYCILGSVMLSKFVIEAYAGKQQILLFSYPVKRAQVMLSKLLLVMAFIGSLCFVVNLAAVAVLGTTELFVPLVHQRMTPDMLWLALELSLTMAFVAMGISLCAVGLGFIKKSVPTTILAAVGMSSLVCNFLFNQKTDVGGLLLFALGVVLVGLFSAGSLMKAVEQMEVL